MYIRLFECLVFKMLSDLIEFQSYGYIGGGFSSFPCDDYGSSGYGEGLGIGKE